jgi:outer membrane lipoprotein-sorting protein
MKNNLKAIAIGIAVAMLVGCGADAPSMAPDAARNSGNLVMLPSSNQNAQNPTQASAQDPRQILSDISSQYQRIQSLSSNMTTFCTANGKSSSCAVNAYFRKPGSLSVVITSNTDAKAVGTKVVYQGGSQCNVKTKFFGFAVKLNLAVTDSRLGTLRGDTLLDTGIVRMMEILLDPNAQHRILGNALLEGRPVTIMEVVSSRALKGITKEIYYIDNQSKIPSVREMYEGSKMVFKCQFKNVALNPQIPATAFTLD